MSDLSARIARLQADFQRIADVHPWVCLALPQCDRPYAFAGEAFGPEPFQQVRPPTHPARLAVTDYVDSLTHEAEGLSLLMVEGPNPLLLKFREEVREWEQERAGGGWIRCLMYAALIRRIPRVANYPQVAASALRWLRENAVTPASHADNGQRGAGDAKVRSFPARRSVDCASVAWGNHLFVFSANQAAIVRILVDAWENGTPDILDGTLLTESDVRCERIADVFKERGGKAHPAWTTMIVSTKKGTHRLQPPPV
jgi:hypothetical protein